MEGSRPFNRVEVAVIQTLTYFDLFTYPLTESEVLSFLGIPADPEAVRMALRSLSGQSLVHRRREFYSLRDSAVSVEERLRGNQRAVASMARAHGRGRLIGMFPFVRSVMISGSLSKGFLSESGDFDYFIITAPGRLWVARLCLTLFKRVFLLNRHRFFCINYLISEDSLEISEKNLFTATELATLIPVYGKSYQASLFQFNTWAHAYLPQKFPRVPRGGAEGQPIIKRSAEWLLSGSLGETLDSFSQGLFWKQWNKRYRGSLPKADFEIAFKSTRSESKLHPRNFQRRVLEQLQDRLKTFYSRAQTVEA